MLAVAVKDFRSTLSSWRTLGASILLTTIVLFAAWGFAQTALAAQEADEEGTVLWEKGANGALTTLSFAVVPLILPLLPVVMAFETLRQDRATGLLDLYLSMPVPKAGIAVGKFLGLLGGLAVVLVLLGGASVILIQLVVGGPIDAGLLAAFILFNLVLGALYLVLTLFLGAVTFPEATIGLAFLAWALFNALQPTGTFLFGQMVGLFRVGEALTFQTVGTDLLSFTGLYASLMAPFVPAELGFVVGADPGSPLAWIPGAVPWFTLAWAAGLLVPFALFLARVPGR